MKASVYYGFLMIALFLPMMIFSVNAQSSGEIPAYKQVALKMADAPQYNPFDLSKKTTDLSKFVSDYTLLSIQPTELKRLSTDKPYQLIVTLPVANHTPMVLYLVASYPIAEGKGVWTQKGKTPATRFPYRHGLHYQGIVKGDIKSTVALSVFEDRIMGVILTATGNYDLGTLSDEGVSNPLDLTYILYNKFNQKEKMPFSCGTLDKNPMKGMATNDGSEAMASVSCKNIVVYFECDSFMFARNNRNVIQTVNFVTGMFNALNAIYINDNIHATLGDVKVWTANDPYKNMTRMGDMLDELRDRQIPNNPFTWDLCQLLTTQGRDWGGLAWLDVLCSSRGYRTAVNWIYNSYSPLPAYSWTLNVLSHEMGHNFGSPHTQWCGWSGGAIDGCAAVEGNCSRPPNANPGTIMSYCHVVTRVDLNLGYGSQPGNRIRQRVAASNCLSNFTVTADIVAPVTNPYQLICNQSVTLQSSTCNGCSYQWKLNGTNIQGATQPTYTTTQTGNYTVSVSKPACGSVTSDILTVVSVPPTPPSISGLNSPYTTQMGPVTMTGTPSGGTFTGNGVNGNTFSPAVAGAGIHSITYSGIENGCPYSITVQVEVIACPANNIVITPGPIFNICDNDSVLLSVPAHPRYTYQWQLNNQNLQGATRNSYFARRTGSYRVIISLANCNTVTTPSVIGRLLPPVNAQINGLQPRYLVINPPVSLTGTPSGGTFSGRGMSGNTFNPSNAGPGTHTIQYSGRDVYGCNYSVSVTVEVLGPSTCPNSLQIVPGPLVNVVQNQTVLLSVPSLPQTTYQWFWNGNSIPNAVQSTYLTGVAGYYTVLIRKTGCPDYVTPVCTVRTMRGAIRLEEQESVINPVLKTYPNPVTSEAKIQLAGITGYTELELYDMKGQKVYHYAIDLTTDQTEVTADFSHLSNGIYLLKAIQKNAVWTDKLIIAHP